MNDIVGCSSGIGPRRNATRRRGARPPGLAREAIGSGSTFPSGASCRKNSGERAQARNRFAGKRFSASHLGGFNRSERSKRYIFSGFLVCGVCGSKLVIASGSGKRGYVKYGCPSHRYRGTCSNGLMIRQDRLEVQLIAGLTERVSKSELIEYSLKRFQEQLQKRLRDIQEQTLKRRTRSQLCKISGAS